MAGKVSIVSLGGDWAFVRPELTRLNRVNLETHALMRARNRMGIGIAIFSALFLVIGVRLADLTLLSPLSPTIAASAATPQQARPDILDRNGRVLATQITTTAIDWRIRDLDQIDPVIAQLRPILPDLNWSIKRERAERTKLVKLASGLSPEQKQQILNLGNPDLELHDVETRVYPNGVTAAHVLGFVSSDQRGLAGLEYYIEELEDWSRPVVTTIDVRVQALMREALVASVQKFSAQKGVAIMMNIHTGEILGLVSFPDFNPNVPMAEGEASHFNGATLGAYELGSVFKMFTVAMALDYELATPTDQFDTSEPLQVGAYTITDLHGQKRPLTPQEILVHSSNIGAGKMALLADADTQAAFWTELGFYDRLSLQIPERGQPHPPQRLGQIERVTASYGHGISMPPLQALVAGAAMINGGLLVQPSLLPVETPVVRRVIRPETSNTLREMLRAVVAEGTARRADIEGYGILGKTGSANKPEKGGYAEDKKITSFIGAFPYRDPRYGVLVMLDEPQATAETRGYNLAGWNAVPLAHEIISRTAPVLGVLPEFDVAAPMASAGMASAGSPVSTSSVSTSSVSTATVSTATVSSLSTDSRSQGGAHATP